MTSTVSTRMIPGPADVRAWCGLAVLLVAVFVATLDVFIVAVAAPTIQADLRAGDTEIQLVLASYNVAYGTLLIPGSRLGDRYGRRRVFAVGLALFGAASLTCGAAPDAGVLIAARSCLGIGAGLMTPQVISLIQVRFTGSQRGLAFGLFAAVGGLGATVSQVIGGVLISADLFDLGWRAIFYVNVPVTGGALLLLPVLVDESRVASASYLDGLGALLLGGSVAAFTVPLSIGADATERGGPALWACAALLASSALTSYWFLRWERRVARAGRRPLVDLSLFRHATYRQGIVSAFLFYSANAALFIVLPRYLQEALGLPVLESGLIFSILAATFSLTAGIAGRTTAAHAQRFLARGAAGLIVAYGALGLTLLTAANYAAGWELVPALIAIAVAMGVVNPAIHVLTVRDVPADRAGPASGTLTTSLELGYGVGIVLGSVIYGAAQATAVPATAFTAALAVPIVSSGVIVTLVRRRRG